jgi:acyl-CoA thioesterase
MTINAEPGANANVDQSVEEALALLPDDARILAAQGVKAARYASVHRYGYLGGLVNMRVEEAEDGTAVLTMDVTPNALNGAGYVHGGMLFTLADYAMGATTRTLLGEGESAVTLEAKANYVSNVKEGRLVARCEALHQSKRLVTLETRINDAASGKLVMIVTGTFYVLKPGEDD